MSRASSAPPPPPSSRVVAVVVADVDLYAEPELAPETPEEAAARAARNYGPAGFVR